MVDHLNKIDFIIKKGIDLAFEHGPRIVGAILVLIIGLYVAKIIQKVIGKMMVKGKIEESLLSDIEMITKDKNLSATDLINHVLKRFIRDYKLKEASEK